MEDPPTVVTNPSSIVQQR